MRALALGPNRVPSGCLIKGTRQSNEFYAVVEHLPETWSGKALHLLFACCVSCVFSVNALAAVSRTAASDPVKVQAPSDDPARNVSLEIKIDTSRSQPYVGSGHGVTAEFKNTSKKAVLYLAERTTTLSFPPELEGPFSPVYGRVAFFPSESDQDQKRSIPLAEREDDVVVAIQPGRSYRAILGTA